MSRGWSRAESGGDGAWSGSPSGTFLPAPALATYIILTCIFKVPQVLKLRKDNKLIMGFIFLIEL